MQPASSELYQRGVAQVFAGLFGRDANDPERVLDAKVPGVIDEHSRSDGLVQFTERPPTYWFTWGSSGSPAFLERGEQLAGIVVLSELGRNEGQAGPKEAFILPATLSVRIWFARWRCGRRNGEAWMRSARVMRRFRTFRLACSNSLRAPRPAQSRRCDRRTME